MNFDKKEIFPGFQTFYVSKESSNCPFISKAVGFGKKIESTGLSEKILKSCISFRYGKRVLINAEESSITHLERESFLEIVDYDPLKNVVLIMGPGDPRVETPIHWLIPHAREEVNVVFQIDITDLSGKNLKVYPETEKEYPAGTLDQAKEVLKALRDSKVVILKNQGVLFVGNSIEDIEKQFLEKFEGSK